MERVHRVIKHIGAIDGLSQVSLQIVAAGYFDQGLKKIGPGGVLKAVAQEVDVESLTESVLPQHPSSVASAVAVLP